MAGAGRLICAEASSAGPASAAQGIQSGSDAGSAESSAAADEALGKADRLLTDTNGQPASDQGTKKGKSEGAGRDWQGSAEKKSVKHKDRKVHSRKKRDRQTSRTSGTPVFIDYFHTEKPKTKKAKVRKKSARKHHPALSRKTRKTARAAAPGLSMAEIRKILATTRNFDGMNLSRANLTGLNFAGATLRGAKLTNADLERTDLQEANLERADLTGTNLHMASLWFANLNAANLDKANLDGAIWTDGRTCIEGSRGFCKDVIP